MMRTEVWIVIFACVIARLSAQEQNGSGASETLDKDILTSQADDNITISWESWYPKVNATCQSGSLVLASNPSCYDRMLNQTRIQCEDAFKTGSERGCVTYEREIDCTADQACSLWSQWEAASQCCEEKRCDYNGTLVSYHHQLRTRSRICINTIEEGCGNQTVEGACIKAKAANTPNSGNKEDDGSTTSNPIRALIFGLAGMVMVGLLLFAVIRLRKVTAQKREAQATRGRPVEGVDNDALMNMPAESRVQTILNNMNANGHHYELRERSDSTPGRRVYVITPTGSPANHASQRGRVFSRATSQLSSIAEESTDDALSRITEGIEPLEDDCVFKYDSDTINEITNEDCAFDEERPKPASSTEAINCINDVIAMYDVDNETTKDLNEMLKRSSVKSQNDFRMSGEGKGDGYLTEFGWRPPQERTWTMAKLKDQDTARMDRRMSTSCSTLNSMYLSNMSIASKDISSAVYNSDDNVSEPLLGNEDVAPSNLKRMKEFSSMPTILDTSQIPDVDQVISQNGQL